MFGKERNDSGKTTMLNIPNSLTLLRILLIPVLVIAYFWSSEKRELIITSVFVLAAVTDWLDGFLARKLNATSMLGAFLDPVADKLIVSSALVLLVSDSGVLARVFHPMPFAVAVCIIIGREIVISALREWMAELGERGMVGVGVLGKVKTVFQMVSIGLLLYAKPIMGIPIFRVGEIAFYFAALLTLWSMWAYLKSAMPYLLEKPPE
ncbi:CDP-diacylglycerol--glycerol-3-phosphate 3-phosphatidyltransferase [Candidatus Spongiihabitans sp.]|uniref:CDP-diacylglycerol--glycerol-3-phosphate 3-phosphatidyltransferase n=1 Tax=Candidatus Spongiihabitans sp. TaxID=3101308 RepID=UPI003C6F5EA2